ncbi:MAG: UbiH/UbiF/VisC/COQ6 family ubiquinone biosynthesis hydroxylase [Pseudomonadota bacterium]|nr:UbiH/UbiF/VisC/COQ6 family ubiquinone biosynthesis hydroxylase [Pseudomonadota bacterium]
MKVDIVVSGGGMVGATLACACAEAGFRVAVIENREPPPFREDAAFDLRVSAISPGTEMVFRTLGVWPLIEERRACIYRRMHVRDAAGTGEIRFDAAELGHAHLGHIIENSVIQDALRQRLKAHHGVLWLCPNTLRRIDVAPETVDVALSDGSRITASLLVGADGARSATRSLAGIGFASRDYHQRALVATVKPQHPHQGTAFQRFLPNGPVALLPLGGDYCSIVWTTSEEQARQLLEMPDGAFCGRLFDATAGLLGSILSTSRRAAFPLRGGQARPYVKPRIALTGDAAHTIHPLAGQGANLGIMDAAALAEILVETSRDIGHIATLRRYERARRGDNELMMRAMEGFNLLFGNTLPPVTLIRNTGLSITNALLPVKLLFMKHAMDISGERPRLARGMPIASR